MTLGVGLKSHSIFVVMTLGVGLKSLIVILLSHIGYTPEDQDTSWLYRYLQEPERTVR